MSPENIYYLFEVGNKAKQEDYIWPVAGKATVNDRVFIVCDGSGSFYGGEVASELICRFMAGKVLKFSEQRMSGDLVNNLLVESRDRLIAFAREHRLDTDLATTFSMLVLYDQKALITWCGDTRIYHLRHGEILYRTNGETPDSEPADNFNIARGIKADGSPIYAVTKWIEDVQDGDYFLLCNKGIIESITDDDITSLISQNDKANLDPTGYFNRLAFDKAPGNYSMYLVKVNTGVQKKRKTNGIVGIRRPANGMKTPMAILAITFALFLIMVFFFWRSRTSNPAPRYIPQANPPAVTLREDTVPSAIIISPPRKPVPKPADSVKTKSEIHEEAPPEDNLPKETPIPPKVNSATVQPSVKTERPKETVIPSKVTAAAVQPEVKKDRTNETGAGVKKREKQLMIKLTTDESCKLEIKNLDLDQVIDWDLSPNDNGTIYLKPGKYSIVATSAVNSSRSKTYNLEVNPQSARTSQNIHIKF